MKMARGFRVTYIKFRVSILQTEAKGTVPVHTMKAYWRNGSIAPLILNLGTRLRQVASFKPPGEVSRHLTNSRPGGPQRRCAYFKGQKISYPSPESNHSSSVVQSLHRRTVPPPFTHNKNYIKKKPVEKLCERKLRIMIRYLKFSQLHCWNVQSSVLLCHFD
jgi:hypothetical protein